MVGDGTYTRRIVDDQLDEIFVDLAAIAIEGPKGVGKTETARQRVQWTWDLDAEDVLDQVRVDSSIVTGSARPTLIDEWQRHPPTWDRVRRAVDDHAPGGSFLLTGSLIPSEGPAHSGAGRIAGIRMRPMSLFERGVAHPVVSLGALLRRERPTPRGMRSTVALDMYVDEILRSGFPGIRRLPPRARRTQLDWYVDRMCGRENELFDTRVRRPATLRAWLGAYAAAVSTTATWESIRTAAAAATGELPAKATAIAYRELLERAWLLEEIPAWLPTRNRMTRLAFAAKHQLADPALTARLLGIDSKSLLGDPARGGAGRDSRMLGQLFESMVTLDVLTYAQSCEARVGHLRTKAGEHEVDLIVEGSGGRIVAIEVKLVGQPRDEDVKHLNWLERQIGDDLIDKVIVTAGQLAYRREDGVLVVPAALLGP